MAQEEKQKISLKHWFMYVMVPLVCGSLLVTGGITFQGQRFQLVKKALELDYLEFERELQDYEQVSTQLVGQMHVVVVLQKHLKKLTEEHLSGKANKLCIDAFIPICAERQKNIPDLKERCAGMARKLNVRISLLGLTLGIDSGLGRLFPSQGETDIDDSVHSDAVVQMLIAQFDAKVALIEKLAENVTNPDEQKKIFNETVDMQKDIDFKIKETELTKKSFEEQRRRLQEARKLIRIEIKRITGQSLLRSIWEAFWSR